MKKILYSLLQYSIRMGFFFYFKRIRRYGIKSVPWDEPLLLLPNHQNALIDPLCIAAYAPKKPYFLTRSDVFVNPVAKVFFEFLRMLPIYRIRDGRDTLVRNRAIFDRCGRLLADSQAILIFPEANHNLQRRVKPLSKGFTRILWHALEQNSRLEPKLVPVGVNYVDAAGFPDSAAFYFGTPIPVRPFDDKARRRETGQQLGAMVQEQLQHLTTHIPEAMEYDATIKVDFLKPHEVRSCLEGPALPALTAQPFLRRWAFAVWDTLFILANLPAVALWRGFIKPRVAEPEFLSTHRFLLGLILYPLAYLLILGFLAAGPGIWFALSLIGAHILWNLLYVKFR